MGECERESGREITSYELAETVCFRSISDLNVTYLNNGRMAGKFDMKSSEEYRRN